MAATRAQKIRLSVFLISAAAIVIATLFYLVGASMLEIRDEYQVILQGGSGGLETGSQVRFNDIVVGRVENVALDKDDPGIVRITLSLEHGTPVTVDTIATPEMANITGTKRLALTGGTKNSQRLSPGDTIKAADSDISMLAAKAVNIANRLEKTLENINEITNPENTKKLAAILSDIEGITGKVNAILDNNEGNLSEIIENAKSLIISLDSSMKKVDSSLTAVQSAVDGIISPKNIKLVSSILGNANDLVGHASSRMSDKELGQTVSSANRLIADTNVAVLSLRTDATRIMRELETSVENINELTQILVENPSVLISGRSEKDRQLP